MTDSKLIDSSVWLAHVSKGVFEEVILSEEQLFLSVISLFEIWKKLIKDKVLHDEASEIINNLKEKSVILDVNEKIAEEAVKVSTEKGVPMADSIIYATAVVHDMKLITCDNDFRGLKGVEVLEV